MGIEIENSPSGEENNDDPYARPKKNPKRVLEQFDVETIYKLFREAAKLGGQEAFDRLLSLKLEDIDMNKENLKPGKYEHYKGKFYKVFGVAKHSETLEELVVYECLYDNPNGKLWVRPLGMFTEEVEIDGKKIPRFKFIGDKE